MKGKTYLWFLVLTGLITLTACPPQQFETTLFQPFENESSAGPRAITWNGRDLVLAAYNQVVGARNIQTEWMGTANQRMDPPNYYNYGQFPAQSLEHMSICGLAWEGDCCEFGYLWVADAITQNIIKVDYHYNRITTFPSPGPAPSGMTFDGNDLWVADEKEGNIYKITTEDGTILEAYRSPMRIPSGLAWDGQGLWVVGMDSFKRSQKQNGNPSLVKMNFTTGFMNEKLNLPKEISRPGSVEWVDGIIWVGDQTTNRVFKLWQKHAMQLGESEARKIEKIM